MTGIQTAFAVVPQNEYFSFRNDQCLAIREKTSSEGGPGGGHIRFIRKMAVDIYRPVADFQIIPGKSDHALDETAGSAVFGSCDTDGISVFERYDISPAQFPSQIPAAVYFKPPGETVHADRGYCFIYLDIGIRGTAFGKCGVHRPGAGKIYRQGYKAQTGGGDIRGQVIPYRPEGQKNIQREKNDKYTDYQQGKHPAQGKRRRKMHRAKNKIKRN